MRQQTCKLHPYLIVALLLGAGLLVATPASAQTQLLDLEQTVPMVSTLDNPCTTDKLEAILFDGAVILDQEVWQQPNGNLRLIVRERTAMEGSEPNPLGAPGPLHAFSGTSHHDIELGANVSATLQSYKKVMKKSGTDDNFHAVLVIIFDPSTLKLDLSFQPACESDQL